MILLSLTATTATTATFAFANLGATGTVELQISAKKNFQFCVAPIYPGLPLASPYVAPGLNQDATYYARARTRLADGTAEAWSNVVGFRTALAVARNTAPGSIVIDPAVIVLPEPALSWAAGNEVAGFPAKNVSRDAPVAWRSIDGGNNHWITLELSGAPWDTIAVMRTNAPEAATITVRGGATAAAATAAAPIAGANAVPFRASPNMPGRDGYHGLVRLAAPVNHRFVRIEIATGGTPAGLLHVEHIVVGKNRQTRNHALDKSETPMNLGSLERIRSGAPDRVDGYKMRRVEFDVAFVTEAQYETLYHELTSRADDLAFVIPNSRAGSFLHDRMLYGDLRSGKVTQPTSIHYTRTFVVESIV